MSIPKLKNLITAFTIALLLVVPTFSPQYANAGNIPSYKAKVTRVVDGDTIQVKLGNKTEKIRMIGVNTPETHHPTKGAEPYGKEAAAFTIKRLTGKTVWLQTDIGERDRYERLLAYVWMRKPQTSNPLEAEKSMFNAELMAKGYAQVMTIPPNVKYADLFIRLQREARENNRGLWGLTVVHGNRTTINQITKKQTK